MAKKSPASSGKMCYYFGSTKTEGKGVGKEILGGKGANLAEMSTLGIPVPPGFTITTEVCAAYYDQGKAIPEGVEPATFFVRLTKRLVTILQDITEDGYGLRVDLRDRINQRIGQHAVGKAQGAVVAFAARVLAGVGPYQVHGQAGQSVTVDVRDAAPENVPAPLPKAPRGD